MARGPHRCCSAPRLSCFMCLHSTDQPCGQFSGSCAGTSAWGSQGYLFPACVFTLSCPCRTWPMPFSRKPRPQGRHTSCRAQLSQQHHTAQKIRGGQHCSVSLRQMAWTLCSLWGKETKGRLSFPQNGAGARLHHQQTQEGFPYHICCSITPESLSWEPGPQS